MSEAPLVEWKPVVGFEGLYEVSSEGGLRSLDRLGGSKWGTPRRYPGGPVCVSVNARRYATAQLTKGGKRKTVKIHRLMGVAFLGAGPEDVVRHLNDVKTDNRLENLAVGTHSDNAYDKVRNGHHWNAEKTECKHGHPFSEENTYVYPGGKKRACKTCRSRSKRASLARARP